MPCAAGDRCAMPDNTPGPPNFTIHPCKGGCGQYLHGICGVTDPSSTLELHRICHTCANSREREERETSGAGTAGAQPKKSDSSAGKGKGSAGASGGVKLGQPAAKKPGGAAKRKRVSVAEKVEALDLLKTMTIAAAAEKLKTGESTLYSWKGTEKKIRDAAAGGQAGAKSSKGGDFPKVEKAVMDLITQARVHGLPVDRFSIQAFGRKVKTTLAEKASATERRQLDAFSASEGWAKKFIRRHNLKSKKLHGQAGSGVEGGQSSAAAAQPPPYTTVAEHFCELEDIAEKCDMSEASYHLRKAKLAWMSAHGSRATKQTCMRDFF